MPIQPPGGVYFAIIVESMRSLGDGKHSKQAIRKHMLFNNRALDFKPHAYDNALRRGVLSGHLLRVKNSYILSKRNDLQWPN